ncbi:unnamed protein product [Spirodela intermedia]|uniref:HMA domain-containing protein n=1 Tax=Spirodela intermedia TaxID=51605 RepID=A0A7I8KSD9_SPIIN|nr:unnamed protein product [Spirodela intermedia]
MGEEEKKPEEKKVEGEGKKEEPNKQEGCGEEKKKEGDGKKEGEGGEKKGDGGGGEGGGEKKESPPPPPPEEIVMRIFMHCEGCARKVMRSLKGFPGVETVTTDCRTHKVVVKGKVAAADPLKVVDRVEKKSGRKVELLTPIPPKPEEKKEEKEEEKPKPEEKKEEPTVISVVLKVHMHCEACLQEIKKRILKMKGVQSVDPDLKSSQVTVKGIFEPQKLVEYIYKRTGKHAAIVKTEPADKKPEDKAGDEKKADGGGEGEKEKKDGGGGEGEKKEGGGGGEGEKKEGGGEGQKEGAAAVDEAAAAVVAAAAKLGELTKNPFLYYYPKYQVEYAYPPQIFSDENPNACSVM